MQGKAWHAETTIQEIRADIAKTLTVCGHLGVSGLRYVGQCGDQYIFTAHEGGYDVTFRATADLDWTMETKKRKPKRRLV